MTKNMRAFLDTIAKSEGTFGHGDDGYDVLVGGKFFDGYADHPRILVDLPKLKIKSTAAGRYQILARNFDFYKKQLGLKDFDKAAQDAIAIQLIKECGALKDIEAGRIESAIKKCASRWASFPGANYGQRENKMANLVLSFERSGGILA
jgi:muramidase (phage lysozyme)